VETFVDRQRERIPFPFTAPEKLVTTIRDAAGIARIHSLLQLGGKTENLRVLADNDLREEDWESNMILIGSPNSNTATGHVLRAYDSPIRFSADVTAIEERASGAATGGRTARRQRGAERAPGNQSWRAGPGPNGVEVDYAMVVKLKVQRSKSQSVYLIIAGIGPTGTLGGCHYLEQNLINLERRFGSDPFALLVSVVRDHYVDVYEEMSYHLTRREDWSRSATPTPVPPTANLSERHGEQLPQAPPLGGVTPVEDTERVPGSAPEPEEVPPGRLREA
jgi:hypothetical protein